MKKLTPYFLAVFVLCVLSYVALWVYSAQIFKQKINEIYASAQNNDIQFLGPKPRLSNFPFTPQLSYTGGFQFGNTKVLFPQIKVIGYPIPFMTMKTKFPNGISLDGPVDARIWTLNNLSLDFIVPKSIPRSITHDDLLEWRNEQGKIKIPHYTMQKDEVTAHGYGYLSLDDALQPIFEFKTTMVGFEEFIETQKQKGLIESFPAAIGKTILNGLSTLDEKTGLKSVTLKVTAKNQMLTVGPIQALPLPVIVWDKRNLPVPRQ